MREYFCNPNFWFYEDQQTAYMLERRFVEAFQNFNKDFLKSCSKEEEAANIPLTVCINKIRF